MRNIDANAKTSDPEEWVTWRTAVGAGIYEGVGTNDVHLTYYELALVRACEAEQKLASAQSQNDYLKDKMRKARKSLKLDF